MDPTTLAVGAGSIMVGLGALLKSRGRKVEAEAAQDEASAKAVVELVAQLGEVRLRVERLEHELREEREAREADREARRLAEERATRAEAALEFERRQSLKLLEEYRASLEKANASHRSWRP